MTEPRPLPETIAAIDLGSNSFHMVVARPRNGELVIIDRIREMVRLASGLDAHKNLSAEVQQQALECLARLGQRLRDLPPGSVRAVGTNTLREAGNGDEFLSAAEQALGHPIEVIPGVEEARLIYQGVAHSIPEDGERRLVIDIGGGSTEFIIGERFEPIEMESIGIGCVSVMRDYFKDGAITAKGARKAELAALMLMESHQARYLNLGWDAAVGASGTIRAVERVVRELGWSDEGITLPALKRVVDLVIKAGHVDRLRLPALSPRRLEVFPGGVMILLAAFEALGIDRMGVSEGALREGLLYDLMGRWRHEDVRSRSVAALAERFGIDEMQASRVERSALLLLARVAAPWGMEDEEARNLLRWAARLHEIGLNISHHQYQKHGAYVLENAELPGFSQQSQLLLATLVRNHRRKMVPATFKALRGAGAAVMAQRLAILLRLAATLHRSRSQAPLPRMQLAPGKNSLKIDFEPGWLDAHPLTLADLEQEAEYLKAAEFDLSFG